MKKIFFAFLLNFMAILNTVAQPAAIDLTFNPTDKGYWFGDGPNGTVLTTAIQNDGKIIIGGAFSWYDGTVKSHITRLNSDGTLDSTFNIGTGATGEVHSTAIQSDGKIIIAGSFGIYNGTSRMFIARLNNNGSVDTGFNPGTGASADIYTTALQSDGKILIAGPFTSYNGTARNGIARLNSNGSLDTGFNPGTGVPDTIRIGTIAIQSDGKIIIGGNFTSYNDTARNYLARLNSNGSLDNSFNQGIGPNSPISTAIIQSDGKILIGGQFTSYNGTARNYIARLNSGGSLDTSFNPGMGVSSFVSTTALQSDGKIIIGGNFASYNGAARNGIARVNIDGSLDSSFDPINGEYRSISASAIQSDGKIMVVGDYTSGGSPAVRLNSNGSLDYSFNAGTGATRGVVQACSIQNDGKIIIGGGFFAYNGAPRGGIARLNKDGSLDNSFNPGSGANRAILTTAIQSDGKIIIGGDFTSYNGTARNKIARLNSNGSLDSSFNPGLGVHNGNVTTATIQSNGKIIIGGTFILYNNMPRNNLARLKTDGSLDTIFNPGFGASGPGGPVNSIAIQKDDKIIISGAFDYYNGTARNKIARLNSDGSLDTGFNTGAGANSAIESIKIQNDGKIIMGGYFTSYNGTARNYIARLNSNGSLDTSFDPGTGANGIVYSVGVQNNGKIMVGGNYTSFNGASRNYITCLNSDGSLDMTFDPGTGTNTVVYSFEFQIDGKIIIGGLFSAYNGTGRNRIARLKGGDVNTITGACYVDYNQNNIQDTGEPGFPNEMVSSTCNTYSFSSATNSQGVFYNMSDTGSATTFPRSHPYYTIFPAQHVSSFSSFKNTDTINFAFMTIVNIQDLRITLIPLNAARTGRGVNYRIVYTNVGTKSMSGSVFMTMNSGLTFVSANPAYSSVSGDTLEWTYSNLVPYELRSIDVTLTVPLSATIGTTLLPSVRVEPIPTDTLPNDNYSTLEQIVTGSYDPNDKTILQGDDITDQQIADGDYLDYLIRFQNTGNDTAFVVVIRDTLDNKLDWNSFEMVSSSHNYSVAIRDGKNIAWTFDNILLPDSFVNEAGSHGYICYRIKPKNTILPGDVIKNTAYIFFDYNVPVATNTAITTVSSPVNIISHPATDKLLIYPNPAEDKITVIADALIPVQLEFYNVLGEVVLHSVLQPQNSEIDISSLQKGIYFLKGGASGKYYSAKLVVQ